MKIIVLGCGNVGYVLAEQLNAEGHEITLVDKNAEQISYVVDTLDIQGIAGNGFSSETLYEAGIEDADLLIAATNEDEINLLSCLLANNLGKHCNTIARVRNPLYYTDINYIKDALSLSMYINPELAAAQEMARLIQVPSALDIDSFDKSNINMIKFKITDNSVLDNMVISDIRLRFNVNMLVCMVQRDGKSFIPNGSSILHSGDIISFVAPIVDLYSIFKNLGMGSRRIKNVMIAGGGRITYYLAQILIKSKINVKIIEKDKARCEELSEQLPEAIVIYGSATNQSLLDEEGVSTTDAFVSVTDMDEENIMLSLYVSKNSDAKVITKIKKVTFEDVVSELDLGSIVNPKNIVAESISSYVRGLQNSYGSNVETLYRLNDDVEAVEFVIKDKREDKLIGIPLMELNLKNNLLICAIKRGYKTFIPGGRDTIEVGDRVIIVTTNANLRDISDIVKN